MAKAMRAYPESCAVLVRRHGVYVWGESWQKAKSMTECFDYLFEMYVKMKQLGIDPEKAPAPTTTTAAAAADKDVATKKKPKLQ